MEKVGNMACANMLVDYTAPTVVIGSLALLLYFIIAGVESAAKIKNQRIESVIAAFSNATLGVYLIHDNNLIRNNVVGQLFEDELSVGAYKLTLLKLIVVVLGVYLLCSIIDIIRSKLFAGIKNVLLRQRVVS